MPRLNRRGQAIAGVGSGPCSVDNVEVSSVGGVANWLTDDIAIYQTRREGRWTVETLNFRNGEVREAAPHGANELGAGGGRFVGFLGGVGLFGEVTLPLGGVSLAFADGRGAVGPDGTVAYVPVRQYGIPTILRAPDGKETTINAVAYGLQVLGPDRAIWNGGSLGLDPAPAMRSGESNRRIVTLPSESWVVSWCEGLGLIAHLYGDATRGFVIQAQPIAFNHDAARLLETDVLVVAYSTSAAELPGQTVVERYDAARRAALMRTFEEATPPDAPPEPTDPAPDPEIPMPDSLEDAVRAERAKYPTPLVDKNDYAKILNKVAWDENQRLGREEWGLSVKPSGNHVLAPQRGPNGEDIYVAYDILHNRPTNTLWGCFGGNPEGVNWGLEDYHGDPEGRPWLAPIAPTGGDDGDHGDEDDGEDNADDDDDDEQPPVTVCTCAAKLAALAARLAILEARPWPPPPPSGESFDPALYIAKGEVSIDVPFFGAQRKTVTLPIIRKP